MSHPVPTQGLASRPQAAVQNQALMGLFGDSKNWAKMEIEVSQAVHKPGQVLLSLLLCAEVGVLHCLRQGKRLGKPLLVPGWKEQLLTLLLGHTEEGFGGALQVFTLHPSPSASPIILPTAPSPASSSCTLGQIEVHPTITQVLGGIS